MLFMRHILLSWKKKRHPYNPQCNLSPFVTIEEVGYNNTHITLWMNKISLYLPAANMFAVAALLLERSQEKVRLVVHFLFLCDFDQGCFDLGNAPTPCRGSYQAICRLKIIVISFCQGVLSPANAHRLHLSNLGLLLLFPAAVIVHEPTISTGSSCMNVHHHNIIYSVHIDAVTGNVVQDWQL